MYMSMSSANVVISDNMQYSSGVGLYADGRDGFISWLRGEFAAANAIIDSLCHHLKSVGEGGEYDEVIGSIQQRRCNWSPVLHMQHYFSVADVLHTLQRVTARRQRVNRGGYYDPVKAGGPGKEYRRSGGVGARHGQNSTASKLLKNGMLKSDEKDVTLAKYNNGLSTKLQVVNNQKTVEPNSECEAKELDCECKPDLKVCSDVHLKNDSSPTHIANQKPNGSAVAKTFVGSEILDGKQINAVEGMKMYEDLFDDSEVGKMVSLVNDLRISGRQRKFQGQTYIVSKRPMKGHGREMIQLGLPIANAPFEDESISTNSKDRGIEPIPSLLQYVIKRLMTMQILTVKPDSCIIDIFNQGDHSQPHSWPHWFGRPICALFLTDCDITFGRVIRADHPGDHKGSIKLSLTPGSMLVMEGRSADFAKYAIPSMQKQRILVTFTKSQPKTNTPSDGQPFPLYSAPRPSSWTPPANRIRHPSVPMHLVSGVLPNVAPRPQLQPSNGIQPIFIPAAVAPAMAFPTSPVALPPASGGWMHHAPLHLPVSGTGVFLPPGGNSPPPKSEPPAPKKENAEEDCNGNGCEMDTAVETQ